jgi:flagellar basal-body rod modification protein FlgD
MAGISNPAVSASSVVNTDVSTAGAASGGYLVNQKDQKTPDTEAKFGEVLKQIQAKYGAKPEKPREIKKTLGKDDFLKIMITQMKNQDPTKPFNADQMAAQMAQYASVEQLQNVNQNLTKMESEHQTSDRMAMTGLIGKTVTVDRERFPHTEGGSESLTFTLSKNASEVKIAIQNQQGETVIEKDLGPQKAGEQSFSWDGLKSNTLPAKTGSYSFKIVAKDERGVTLPTDPRTTGRIIGVSFEGSEPVFLVGDSKAQQKITLRSIVRIDDVPLAQANPQGAGQVIAGARTPGAPAGAVDGNKAPMAGGKFFSFTKGVGSQNLDSTQLSPEAQQALAKYEAQRAEAEGAGQAKAEAKSELAAAAKQIGSGEKGFPNGLSGN